MPVPKTIVQADPGGVSCTTLMVSIGQTGTGTNSSLISGTGLLSTCDLPPVESLGYKTQLRGAGAFTGPGGYSCLDAQATNPRAST